MSDDANVLLDSRDLEENRISAVEFVGKIGEHVMSEGDVVMEFTRATVFTVNEEDANVLVSCANVPAHIYLFIDHENDEIHVVTASRMTYANHYMEKQLREKYEYDDDDVQAFFDRVVVRVTNNGTLYRDRLDMFD